MLASTGALGVLAATTLAAVVVIAYTAIGGMWADSWTDLVQGLVLIAGIIALAVVFAHDGGFAQLAVHGINAPAPADDAPRPLIERWRCRSSAASPRRNWLRAFWRLRSPELARSATIAGALMYLLVGSIPVAIGLGAAATIGPGIDPEQLLAHLAQIHLPIALYILFLGALVSAILSTLSGTLLVAGSLAAHNLVAPLAERRGRPLSERSKLPLESWCGGGVWSVVVRDRTRFGQHVCAGRGSVRARLVRRVRDDGRRAMAATAWRAYQRGRRADPQVLFSCSASTCSPWSYPYLASLLAAAAGYLFFAPLREREPVLTA